MHWDLPCAPGSAAVARRHVAAACSHLGREFHDVAVLLASELVGNAVEHARSDAIHLVVDQQASRFRVEVHDELFRRVREGRIVRFEQYADTLRVAEATWLAEARLVSTLFDDEE